ncbi:hypothetical protein BaRGS_00022756 [Batillaria attramentaria]|uniref:UvrD-like helicase ATP-binding domain-containing protein n=1 Tax=Batillaria attramentaria TaxID=370345 RepID=A0ABD0KFP5_9CAEN
MAGGFKFTYRKWQHRPFLRNPHRQQLNDHPSDSMARSVEGHHQALTSSSDSQHMNSLLAVGTLEDDRTRHAGFSISSQLNDHASRQMGRPVEEQRPVQGQSANKRRGKTKPRKKPVIPQCKECEQRLSAARRHFHHGTKTVMAHSALQDIFRCSHEKNCANEGFELKAVELIMEQLSRSNTTDFPTFLWDLPNRLHQVLDRLIREKNWNQVCVVMKKAQEDNASSVKQRAVAAKIPVKDLVGTDDGKEYSRCEILAFILTFGARGSTQSEYVSHLGTALRHREFLIAEELFRFVEDPPLHVAFHMALEKDSLDFCKVTRTKSAPEPLTFHPFSATLSSSFHKTLHVVDERALYLIKAFIKELRGFTVEEATRAEASVEKWSEVKDHDADAETEGGRRGTVVRESRETATGEAQVSKGLELFEAKLSKGERIVWEQAVAFSPRLSTTENYVYAEVIRVWDIVLDHKKIHASVQRIRNSHKRGQCSVIKKHLKLETHTAGHGTSSERTIHPKTYSEVETGGDKKQVDVTTTEQLQLYLPAMDEETQFQIHKFYSVSSLLDSVLENTDVQIEWPLRATAVEHAVISLPQDSPVLLLGRSGTGKTTCCLYRLWNSFLRYCKASDLVNDQDVRLQLHPHQLFVTKNPVLCSEVQKNFHGLCLGNAAVRSRVAMMNASIPHRLQDIHGHQYPLFLTSKQLILMLDASLPKPHFFDRDDNGRLLQEVAGYNEATDMFAPYTPLDEVKGKVSMSSASKEKKSKKVEARVEVSYHMFATRIWPEIKHKVELGKDCHPSLVWLEIMSFIKGSFEALETTLGYLSREEYERIGRKRAPSFTGNRDDVYRLFELYNTYKKGHRLYDEADLLFNIYQRLKAAEPRLQWELHEIYVDETQDFTQAELSLLVKLADNPNHMFLAGDTAQCIMQGVSFRFEDLKTLFYYAKRDSPKTQDKRSVITVPRVHQLKFNYRSHRGILNLASAIVDLLVDFFPESFDRLERDQGFLDGPKPVLLDISNCDMNDLTLLLTGDKQRTSHIEFGAHQAILVANDEAREKVPEELRQGIILTIYEAKGLEFDDVLLYNFFQDSQADDEWRVVMDYLKRHPVNIPDTSDSSSNTSEAFLSRAHSRPLPFDPKLHKILNSELKQLYTAVTRARVNVWFFDEKTSPMLYYCHALGLMDVKEVDISEGAGSDSGSGMYAKKSSPSEWETQGDMFMSQQLYKVAAKCFQNAGADHKRRIAQVHDRLLEAFKMADEPRDAKCTAYLRAAILLLQCAYELSDRPSAQVTQYNLLAKAAKSLQTARVRLQAAQIFEKICKFEEAAKLYSDAGEASKAAQCWEKLRN